MSHEKTYAWRKANPERWALHQRRAHLKRRYGITIEQYDEMLARQDGRCAFCDTDAPKGKGTFHVDHDHVSGRVRALLCSPCNTFIRDEEEHMRAINYIRSAEPFKYFHQHGQLAIEAGAQG